MPPHPPTQIPVVVLGPAPGALAPEQDVRVKVEVAIERVAQTTTAVPAEECIDYDYLVPLILDRFIASVTSIAEVCAIVAEPLSADTLHITTFALPLTDEVSEKVYEAERQLIDQFPVKILDFHLRQPEMVDGLPSLPASTYSLVLWRRSDAE